MNMDLLLSLEEIQWVCNPCIYSKLLLYHYENKPVQYIEIFFSCKNRKFQRKMFDIFLIFAEAVLTSTHNLCFEAKIRKIGIPLHTQILLYKSGV